MAGEEELRTASGTSFRGWRELRSQPRPFLFPDLPFQPIPHEDTLKDIFKERKKSESNEIRFIK